MDHEPTSHKKPVFPSLTSDDIKLLVITFAGTVAANLVTVLFVGLAIASAHFFGTAHTPLPYIILLVITIGSIVAPVLTFVTFRSRRYNESTTIDKLLKKIVIGSAIALIGFALFFVLFWVGRAAGIK